MEFLKKITSANHLTEIGISVIASWCSIRSTIQRLIFLLTWGICSDNIMGILGGLSNEGLLGLVGACFIPHS